MIRSSTFDSSGFKQNLSITSIFFIFLLLGILSSSFKNFNNQNSLNENKQFCKKKPKLPFGLISAYSKQIIPGQPNQPIETSYSIEVKLNEEGLVFDSIWLDEKVFPITISKRSKSITPKGVKYHKGDTIILHAFELEGSNTLNNSVSPPKSYKGAALIRYYYLNKREYYPILTIEKRKNILRQ